jgi:hypothetical protein
VVIVGEGCEQMGTWDGVARSTPGGAAAASVRERLEALAGGRATGRLAVKGVAGGWIHLQDGAIACAERSGSATLLVAMGEAGLFSAEEWQVAMRLPFGPRWPALVGGDDARLRALTAFAHDFVVAVVAALVDHERTGQPWATAFAPGVTHPFGPLATWSVAEVLAAAPPPPIRAAVPAVDRAEFLELLEEVSPHVRHRPDGGAVAPALREH